MTWLTCRATKQFPRKNFTRTSLSLQIASAAVKDRKQLTLKFSPLPLPPRILTTHSYLRHVIYSFLKGSGSKINSSIAQKSLSQIHTTNSSSLPTFPPSYWNSIFSLPFPPLLPPSLPLDCLPCWSSALRGSCIHGNRHCLSSERIWRKTNRLHSHSILNQVPFHLHTEPNCSLLPNSHLCLYFTHAHCSS